MNIEEVLLMIKDNSEIIAIVLLLLVGYWYSIKTVNIKNELLEKDFNQIQSDEESRNFILLYLAKRQNIFFSEVLFLLVIIVFLGFAILREIGFSGG